MPSRKREGYLTKLGNGGFKRWVPRFVKLDGDQLQYAMDEAAKPKGTLHVMRAINSDEGGRKFGFSVQGPEGRCWNFSAHSANVKDAWMSALNNEPVQKAHSQVVDPDADKLQLRRQMNPTMRESMTVEAEAELACKQLEFEQQIEQREKAVKKREARVSQQEKSMGKQGSLKGKHTELTLGDVKNGVGSKEAKKFAADELIESRLAGEDQHGMMGSLDGPMEAKNLRQNGVARGKKNDFVSEEQKVRQGEKGQEKRGEKGTAREGERTKQKRGGGLGGAEEKEEKEKKGGRGPKTKKGFLERLLPKSEADTVKTIAIRLRMVYAAGFEGGGAGGAGGGAAASTWTGSGAMLAEHHLQSASAPKLTDAQLQIGVLQAVRNKAKERKQGSASAHTPVSSAVNRSGAEGGRDALPLMSTLLEYAHFSRVASATDRSVALKILAEYWMPPDSAALGLRGSSVGRAGAGSAGSDQFVSERSFSELSVGERRQRERSVREASEREGSKGEGGIGGGSKGGRSMATYKSEASGESSIDIQAKDILVDQWTSTPGMPAHFLALHHSKKTLVLSICGSAPLNDVLLDLTMDVTGFLEGSCTSAYGNTRSYGHKVPTIVILHRRFPGG
jgi:hypothetical protein